MLVEDCKWHQLTATSGSLLSLQRGQVSTSKHTDTTEVSEVTLERHCWFLVRALPPIIPRSTCGGCTSSYIHSVGNTPRSAVPLRETPHSTESNTEHSTEQLHVWYFSPAVLQKMCFLPRVCSAGIHLTECAVYKMGTYPRKIALQSLSRQGRAGQ